MATLVLTTVGTLFGGPVGGALGALVGQQIDSRLFAPKGRKGPRLGELGVQTSSYGSPIPKIFGTMRVAGTVIWATDLREDRHRQGGGKGRPKTTSYSYSASFAVLLSGRPIVGAAAYGPTASCFADKRAISRPRPNTGSIRAARARRETR